MNFAIKPCTHFLVIAGSHAYGTNTPESDLDVKGWAIPPLDFIVSYTNKFEQNDTKKTLIEHPFSAEIANYLTKYKVQCQVDPVDSTIYNLQKFVFLAADCNPNIIDLLFTKDSEVIVSDSYGDALRENATAFLSQRARYSFTGYAVSQLKRIHTHRRWLLDPPKKKPMRSEYGLPDSSLVPHDQLQAAQALIEKRVRLWLLEEAEIDKTIIDHVQEDLLTLVGNLLNTKTTEEARDKLEYTIGKSYGMSEEYLSVLQREKKYKAALTEFNQYESWLTNRNPVRAELERKYNYDVKHASHLIRLLVEAEEILNTGKLTLKQPEHVEFFKAIKAGVWTFERLIEWSAEKMAVLQDKNMPCAVPKTPDVNKLDALYRRLVLERVGERNDIGEADDDELQ